MIILTNTQDRQVVSKAAALPTVDQAVHISQLLQPRRAPQVVHQNLQAKVKVMIRMMMVTMLFIWTVIMIMIDIIRMMIMLLA